MKIDENGVSILILGGISLTVAILIMTQTENRGIVGFIGIMALITGVIALMTVVKYSLENKQNEMQEFENKEIKAKKEAEVVNNRNETRKRIEELYGTISNTIILKRLQLISDDVKVTSGHTWYYFAEEYIFTCEDSSHVIIKEKAYSFSDILAYELTDNSRVIYSSTKSQTKTSTGSMLGRAVVGGVLLGGVGAIIGGATAKTETITEPQISEVHHDYSINLILNNISTPRLTIEIGVDGTIAQDAIALFSVIVERNKDI